MNFSDRSPCGNAPPAPSYFDMPMMQAHLMYTIPAQTNAGLPVPDPTLRLQKAVSRSIKAALARENAAKFVQAAVLVASNEDVLQHASNRDLAIIEALLTLTAAQPGGFAAGIEDLKDMSEALHRSLQGIEYTVLGRVLRELARRDQLREGALAEASAPAVR